MLAGVSWQLMTSEGEEDDEVLDQTGLSLLVCS